MVYRTYDPTPKLRRVSKVRELVRRHIVNKFSGGKATWIFSGPCCTNPYSAYAKILDQSQVLDLASSQEGWVFGETQEFDAVRRWQICLRALDAEHRRLSKMVAVNERMF